MMSIGVLGFVVWSWVLASPHSDMWINIIYLAISWNGLVLISTLNCKNLISYTRSAGNLSLYSARSNIQSASETIRWWNIHLLIFQLLICIIVRYLGMLRNICPITDRGKPFLLQDRATFQVGLQGSQRAWEVKIL